MTRSIVYTIISMLIMINIANATSSPETGATAYEKQPSQTSNNQTPPSANNQPSNSSTQIPKNCTVWFDGCNMCNIVKTNDGKTIMSCTKRYCAQKQPARCIHHSS